jgi:predicted nucleic acid-binding protein
MRATRGEAIDPREYYFPEDAGVKANSDVARVGRTLPHWLLEGIFIIVSVALGFGVAQFNEYRDNRELAARALKSLQTELEHNLSILEPMVPVHRNWVKALAKADTSKVDQSGLDVYFATRPDLPSDSKSPFPFLRRSAWDAALSGGALRLIDYDVAAALSEIYRVQEIAIDNVDRSPDGTGSRDRRPALEQFRKHPAVGFSDCLMLELARKTGHPPLGTFDRDLGKVDGAQRL